MKKLVFCVLFFLNVCAYANSSPVGYWKTVDDVTGRVQSIVQIYEASDHSLSGKIIKTFPKPGDIPLTACTACKDSRHNKPIIGLVIMNNLQFNDGAWTNGEIIDPKSGKIYKCFIKPFDNSTKLTVRGYIGIPLFGRTQTWLRTYA